MVITISLIGTIQKKLKKHTKHNSGNTPWKKNGQ